MTRHRTGRIGCGSSDRGGEVETGSHKKLGRFGNRHGRLAPTRTEKMRHTLSRTKFDEEEAATSRVQHENQEVTKRCEQRKISYLGEQQKAQTRCKPDFSIDIQIKFIFKIRGHHHSFIICLLEHKFGLWLTLSNLENENETRRNVKEPQPPWVLFIGPVERLKD
jgi:hypothetical protein